MSIVPRGARCAKLFACEQILLVGRGEARTEIEEEDKNEITKLLSNLNLHEICAHMQEVHAGYQKCGGCPIPVDIVIPVAGLQPTLEIFLELNKDEGFKLGNRAFNEILTYWKESLEKIDQKCQKGTNWWEKYFASSQANIKLLVQKCQENEDFVYKPSNKPSDKTDYRRELETKKGIKELESYMDFVIDTERSFSCPFCSRPKKYSKIFHRNVHIKKSCKVLEYQKRKISGEADQNPKKKKERKKRREVYSDAFSSPVSRDRCPCWKKEK
jgi:hypothetical protein